MPSHVVTNPPPPGSPEWRKLITASKVPAMVRYPEGHELAGQYTGCDYYSAFERWHLMNGTWEEHIDSDTQKMFDDAHDAEDYGANVWKRANPGWQLNKGEVTYTSRNLRFPHCVTLDRRARRGSRRHIIEVKRPRRDTGVRDNWWLQVIFQMGVSGIHEASVVIIPVYGEPQIYEIEWDETVFQRICADAEHFWGLLHNGTPPEAGDSENAKEILAALRPVTEGASFDVPDSAVDELRDAYEELEAAQRRVTSAENSVAEMMGDSATAVWNGARIASRQAGRFAQSRVPKGSRHLLDDPDLMTPKFDVQKLREKHPDVYNAAVGKGSFKFEKKAIVGL